ncbi:MAG: hypothetical protein Q8O67_01045 [Deltaproteobacteria bacterium]|nr:hypothetical protein [Deltaproteobacteria bacterium]
MQIDDEYARKYMATEGEALYFDKRKWSPQFGRMLKVLQGVVVVSGAVTGVAGLINGEPQLALMALPMIGLTTVMPLLWSTLRTMVTSQFVHIQYGLFGPRIAVTNVISAEVVQYDWKKYGGWGVRYALDGSKAYNMMGDQGTAVKIVYQDGKKQRVVLVSAAGPQHLASAINEAMKKATTTTSTAAGSLADARLRLDVKDAPAPDVIQRQTAVTLDEQMPADVRERLEAAKRERP